MARPTTDPLLRFARLFTEAPGGCYEWTGRLQTHSLHPERGGYPVFRVLKEGRWVSAYAHRWILEQALGRSIAEGHEADHICHNRCCVNPDHLREVCKADNIREATKRRCLRA